MKRILIVTTLLITAISGIAGASSVDSINIGGDTQGFIGDTKTILINVVNANDIDIFQLDLLYDSNILKITNVVEGDSKIKFAALKPGTNVFNINAAGPSGAITGSFTLAKIDVEIIGPENSVSNLNLNAKAKKIDYIFGFPTGAHDVEITNIQNSKFVVLPTSTPTPSPSPTPTASPNPTPTASPSPTPTASPSPTPTVLVDLNAGRTIDKNILTPDGETGITVAITNDNVQRALSLHEMIPPGWIITNVFNDADTFKINNSVAEWVWYSVTSNAVRNVKYNVIVPPSTKPGTYNISGHMTTNEIDISVTGDNTISVEQGDILAYYRGLGKYPDIVETADLLVAADDWRDNIVPPKFSTSLITQQLLTLADEWRNS